MNGTLTCLDTTPTITSSVGRIDNTCLQQYLSKHIQLRCKATLEKKRVKSVHCTHWFQPLIYLSTQYYALLFLWNYLTLTMLHITISFIHSTNIDCLHICHRIIYYFSTVTSPIIISLAVQMFSWSEVQVVQDWVLCYRISQARIKVLAGAVVFSPGSHLLLWACSSCWQNSEFSFWVCRTEVIDIVLATIWGLISGSGQRACLSGLMHTVKGWLSFKPISMHFLWFLFQRLAEKILV